jgi:RNA polymerase sigma-70 factor (ECF subfamily)
MWETDGQRDGRGLITYDPADLRAPRSIPLDGSGETWAELYREVAEKVFRVVYRLTGSRDIAEDVTQEAFVRAYEQRHHCRERERAAGWICRIAINLAKDRGRVEARRHELLEQAGTRQTHGGDVCLAVEAGLVLDRALSTLSEEQRAALLLYDVDGYSHAEIAAMFEIAEATSRARVARARAAMREQIGEWQ